MRRKIAFVCTVFVAVLLGVVTIYESDDELLYTMPPAEMKSMSLPAPTESKLASAKGEVQEESLDGGGYYILQAYMQRLAVYRVYSDGTKALVDIIDMDIRVLPDRDVESLKDGIVLRDEEALIRILEDFMS